MPGGGNSSLAGIDRKDHVMLKLWGRTNSSNVKKVMWACAELGVPYERIDAGLQFGVNNTDEYRAKNPNGMVPLIDDDGFVLWESNAIVRYLCNKHPKAPFWPDSPQLRASADRWMDWQCTTIGPMMSAAFMKLVRDRGGDWDINVINKQIPKAAGLWALADRQLGQTQWLTGDDFTAGDVPLAILAYTWFEMPLEQLGLAQHRVPLANLDRWYAQLNAMPNFREIVAIGLT
jgi:glutathione S-transferase